MISIIAALTSERVIGKNGKLPWNIPEEMEKFKKHTSGATVIMGRKTYESIGKPLPNRRNIVVSRTLDQKEGVEICQDLASALSAAKADKKEVFIIGGSRLYDQGLDVADRMYLSHIHEYHDGDTFFPKYDPAQWKVLDTESYDKFTFTIYERKK